MPIFVVSLTGSGSHDIPDYAHRCGEVLSFDGRRSQLGVNKPDRDLEAAREAVMLNVGKKAAGSILDGREHRAFPEVSRG